MPASPHFILMTVYPSGMLITPVQQGGRVASHVKIVSHFHLRGTVAPSLLQRLRGNRMLEARFSPNPNPNLTRTRTRT